MLRSLFNRLFRKLTRSEYVYNKERKMGAATGYYLIGPVDHLEVDIAAGEITSIQRTSRDVLLFTAADLKKARDRAAKNREDIPADLLRFVPKQDKE